MAASSELLLRAQSRCKRCQFVSVLDVTPKTQQALPKKAEGIARSIISPDVSAEKRLLRVRVAAPKPACIIEGKVSTTCCSDSVLPMWKHQTLLVSRTLSVSLRCIHVDLKGARQRACYVCSSAIQTPPIQAPAMGVQQNGALPMPKVSSRPCSQEAPCFSPIPSPQHRSRNPAHMLLAV